MASGTIHNVSDTARWVAMYRAIESERPDAIFHDPFARRLAGAEGAAILESLPKARKEFSWPMVVRTAVMDDLILGVIRRDGADTVLNLAAGLDTRAFRLELPASLRWYDVDFTPMLEYKQEQLAREKPRCLLEYVPVDLTSMAARKALFARVASASAKVLVITEGLLVYLSPEQVADLARDLAGQPTFRWWILDIVGPEILKRLKNLWGGQLEAAPLKFGPAELTRFFEPYGWKERDFRSTVMESVRLKRTMLSIRFWHTLLPLFPRKKREEMARAAGFALLERA